MADVKYEGHQRNWRPYGRIALVWSPRGSHVASAATHDHRVHVWDAGTARRIRIYDHPASVTAVAWSSNDTIAAGDDSGIITLHPQPLTLDLLGRRRGGSVTYTGHQQSSRFNWISSSGERRKIWDTAPVVAIAWTPDGERVLSASGEPGISVHRRMWRIWDARDGRDHAMNHEVSGITDVAWAPDGTRFAWAQDDDVIICRSSGTELLRIRATPSEWDAAHQHVQAIAWSPDGDRIATAHGGLKVWEVDSGRLIVAFDELRYAATAGWSPDGNDVLTSSSAVYVVDARTGSVKAEFGHVSSGAVTCAAWSPRNRRVAYADGDGVIHIVDA